MHVWCSVWALHRKNTAMSLFSCFFEFSVSLCISYPGDRRGPHNGPPLLLWFPHIKLIILKILKDEGGRDNVWNLQGRDRPFFSFFLIIYIPIHLMTFKGQTDLQMYSPVPALRRRWPPAPTRSSHTLLPSSYLRDTIGRKVKGLHILLFFISLKIIWDRGGKTDSWFIYRIKHQVISFALV